MKEYSVYEIIKVLLQWKKNSDQILELIQQSIEGSIILGENTNANDKSTPISVEYCTPTIYSGLVNLWDKFYFICPNTHNSG